MGETREDYARRVANRLALPPVEEVYPRLGDNGYFDGPGDYNPLLESFGYSILFKTDDDDYQGDSWILFGDGERFGYLQFGWGSCSGCDALLASNSYQDIDELRQQLMESIVWWDSAREALKWFKEHDWDGDYSRSNERLKEFRRDVEAELWRRLCYNS